MVYLDIHGSDPESIANVLEDIKESIRNGTTNGEIESYGEYVAWKLNTFQR